MRSGLPKTIPFSYWNARRSFSPLEQLLLPPSLRSSRRSLHQRCDAGISRDFFQATEPVPAGLRSIPSRSELGVAEAPELRRPAWNPVELRRVDDDAYQLGGRGRVNELLPLHGVPFRTQEGRDPGQAPLLSAPRLW